MSGGATLSAAGDKTAVPRGDAGLASSRAGGGGRSGGSGDGGSGGGRGDGSGDGSNDGGPGRGEPPRHPPAERERPGDPASPRLRARNARLTVYLLLSASTMLFLGLLGAFMVLKQAAPQWPPKGSPPLPSWLAWNTVLIVLSSGTLVVAHAALRRGAMAVVRRALAATTLLGLAFLSVQWFGWADLRADGFLPSSNNYGGNFWLLTTLHFAHAVGGIALLLRASVLSFRGYSSDRLALPVEVAALFWHFVDVAWLVIGWSLL
jgi:cytochrome c oxidase subunit 3